VTGGSTHWKNSHWRGEDFVVVTPVQGASHPEKLFVSAAMVSGTLGDAASDAEAIEAARDLLTARGPAQLVKLSASGLQCLIDPVLAPGFRIVLFGAGHVARALVPVLGGLPVPDHVGRHAATTCFP
jgi:xanthine dehydrogenase accessory factor